VVHFLHFVFFYSTVVLVILLLTLAYLMCTFYKLKVTYSFIFHILASLNSFTFGRAQAYTVYLPFPSDILVLKIIIVLVFI